MLPSHAYNPSLIRYQNKLLATCRAHDRNDWRTNLYIAQLTNDLKVEWCSKLEAPASLVDQSHEDARLFIFNNELWVSWTIGLWPVSVHRSKVALGKVRQVAGQWQIDSYFVPEYGRNDGTRMEKNWLPFECNGKLWAYYETNEHDQVFIRFEGPAVVETVRSPAPKWNYGPIHGGAIGAAKDDTLWFFFNSRINGNGTTLDRYHIGCAELRRLPPFEVLRIGKKPVLYGQEGYNLDGYRFFKPNVCFATGLVQEKDRLLLAHGWNDAEARVAKLKEGELNL